MEKGDGARGKELFRHARSRRKARGRAQRAAQQPQDRVHLHDEFKGMAAFLQAPLRPGCSPRHAGDRDPAAGGVP